MSAVAAARRMSEPDWSLPSHAWTHQAHMATSAPWPWPLQERCCALPGSSQAERPCSRPCISPDLARIPTPPLAEARTWNENMHSTSEGQALVDAGADAASEAPDALGIGWPAAERGSSGMSGDSGMPGASKGVSGVLATNSDDSSLAQEAAPDATAESEAEGGTEAEAEVNAKRLKTEDASAEVSLRPAAGEDVKGVQGASAEERVPALVLQIGSACSVPAAKQHGHSQKKLSTRGPCSVKEEEDVEQPHNKGRAAEQCGIDWLKLFSKQAREVAVLHPRRTQLKRKQPDVGHRAPRPLPTRRPSEQKAASGQESRPQRSFSASCRAQMLPQPSKRILAPAPSLNEGTPFESSCPEDPLSERPGSRLNIAASGSDGAKATPNSCGRPGKRLRNDSIPSTSSTQSALPLHCEDLILRRPKDSFLKLQGPPGDRPSCSSGAPPQLASSGNEAMTSEKQLASSGCSDTSASSLQYKNGSVMMDAEALEATGGACVVGSERPCWGRLHGAAVVDALSSAVPSVDLPSEPKHCSRPSGSDPEAECVLALSSFLESLRSARGADVAGEPDLEPNVGPELDEADLFTIKPFPPACSSPSLGPLLLSAANAGRGLSAGMGEDPDGYNGNVGEEGRCEGLEKECVEECGDERLQMNGAAEWEGRSVGEVEVLKERKLEACRSVNESHLDEELLRNEAEETEAEEAADVEEEEEEEEEAEEEEVDDGPEVAEAEEAVDVEGEDMLVDLDAEVVWEFALSQNEAPAKKRVWFADDVGRPLCHVREFERASSRPMRSVREIFKTRSRRKQSRKQCVE